MIVNIKNKWEREFRVCWEHKLANNKIYSHITECLIYDRLYTTQMKFSHEELEGEGKSFCSNKDVFDKNIGRKLSLERALKDGECELLTKEDRKIFWLAYHKQSQKNLISSSNSSIIISTSI